ncbi:hypothetical protein [Oceaniglobus indicus]|uniref:hypothetical protein n=1 Tax=Oceaniglobus indicus TaxID=2047749 RepID=UPI000C19671D|nr:hypothetical protein [Oceaniglobus indicus]
MMPLRHFAAALIVLCLSSVSHADDHEVLDCQERMARSLAVMEAAPLMKEEKATGLMWLRLDAANALARGDVEVCHEKLDAVDTILLIRDRTERAGR